MNHLDTVVNMSTTALTVPRSSTLAMSSVWFVEAKRKEPVFDVILGDSFDVVVGNLAHGLELGIPYLEELHSLSRLEIPADQSFD